MKKILVVDNEPIMCSLLSKFLTDKGYQVTTVLSGEEAINKVKKTKFHLIFLDIRMPGLDGIETLKRIKEIDKETTVIMITVVDDDKVGRKCLELGAYDYIVKPLNLKYLEDVLMVKLLGFGN